MIVGFYKDGAETLSESQVVSYSDRIWLRETGDALVLRTFTIAVSATSPAPLTEIKLLLPRLEISDLRCENDTAFDSDYHFNSPSIRTTGVYKVISIPNINCPDYGLIDDDKIAPIKIYKSSAIKATSWIFKTCRVLHLQLPEPLKAGEFSQFRLSFVVENLGDCEIAAPMSQRISCSLSYFAASLFPEETDTLSDKNLIPVRILTDEPKVPGGFTILMYAPPTFRAENFSGSPVQKPDKRHEGGLVGESRLKMRWHLRALVDGGIPSSGIVPSDARATIEVSFIASKSDTVIKELETLPGRMTATEGRIGGLTTEVRIATAVAILALLLAIPATIDWVKGLTRRPENQNIKTNDKVSPGNNEQHVTPLDSQTKKPSP